MSDDFVIDTQLRPGDLGYLVYLHGKLYAEEFGYMQGLEIYAMESILESINNFSPRDRFWIARTKNKIAGSIALINRGEAAQL